MALTFAPSLHWPRPIVANEPPAEYDPVLVTLEYQIDPLRLQDFLAAMHEVQLSRRRGGAIRWGLYQDGASPGRYIETFVVESWIDHLRQHERVTLADRMAEEHARSFHLGTTTPAVSHFVAAQW